MLKILCRTSNALTLTLHSFTPSLFVLDWRSPPFNSLFSSEPEAAYSTLSHQQRDKSEQVKSLLKTHGFTDTQISKLTRVRPKMFFLNPQNTIAPKIDFLLSIGISKAHLPNVVSLNPSLMFHSLQNRLIPNYNFLKTLLIQNQTLVKMLKLSSRSLLCGDVNKVIAPNISILTQIGVPNRVICFLLVHFPGVAAHNPTKFNTIVNKVIRMGFDPTVCGFVNAVKVLCQSSDHTWARKWEAYRRWGWSDDEILMAFRSFPNCMGISEEKITKGMDFFINKMGWEAVKIARRPVSLSYSLEKRIIPRCRVLQVLISKGILKNDMTFTTVLSISEQMFMERFVTKYGDKVPDILNIYRQKTCSLESPIGSENKLIVPMLD